MAMMADMAASSKIAATRRGRHRGGRYGKCASGPEELVAVASADGDRPELAEAKAFLAN
jgi:hypothetical protein